MTDTVFDYTFQDFHSLDLEVVDVDFLKDQDGNQIATVDFGSDKVLLDKDQLIRLKNALNALDL